MRGRTRLLRLAVAGFAAVAAVLVLPDLLFGLDQRSPFAQVVPFRPLVLAALVPLVLVLVLARSRRVLRPFAAVLAAVLVVGAVLVVPRLVPGEAPAGGRQLTVLALNTRDGGADPASVAGLVARDRPDLVSLTESGPAYAARLAEWVEPLGYVLRSTSDELSESDIQHITVAYRRDFGDVRAGVGTDSSFPYLTLTGGGLGDLTFVAFRALAPLPGLLPGWRSDLAGLQRWCASGRPVVIAGDLNATLDHSALRSGMRGCADAAAEVGAGLIPTWAPRRVGDVGRLLGPQIDHVIVSGGPAAEAFEVADVPGTDHRAVVARLRVDRMRVP